MSKTGVSKLARCTLAAALALTATGCSTLRSAATNLWSFTTPAPLDVPLGPGTSRVDTASSARTPIRGTVALPGGLRAEALIALGGLGLGTARPAFVAANPEQDVEGSTHVVRAHVTLHKRIVPDERGGASIEPRVGLLARELAKDGKLTPGTPVKVVYRELERRCARHIDPSRSSDAHVDACGSGEAARELAAVQIGTGPSARRAFFVRDDARGLAGFYTRDGRPLERARLRYPVEYMLVTSRFSSGRPHPILKRRKPHNGIDFAAPRGTPVVAIGDGEILHAGWEGQYGRQVSIRHADGTIAGYSHLDRIATGIESGGRVRKGEIIGTIGSSGLATGPHLHFSIVRGGKFVDPAAVIAPAAPLLSGAALQALHALTAQSNVALALAAREDVAKGKADPITRLARTR